MVKPGFVLSSGSLTSWKSSSFTGSSSEVSSLSTSRRPFCATQTKPRANRAARFPSMQLGSPSTQIGRPKTSIKKSVGVTNDAPAAPEADTGKGAAKARPRRKTLPDEVPMYKVILLGEEEYVEAHVVTQLQKTVGIDKKEASRKFHEAQQSGSSVVCVVCEEHAEFYAQQLKRQDIFVTVEKDE